jgi:hypothetical protein
VLVKHTDPSQTLASDEECSLKIWRFKNIEKEIVMPEYKVMFFRGYDKNGEMVTRKEQPEYSILLENWISETCRVLHARLVTTILDDYYYIFELLKGD